MVQHVLIGCGPVFIGCGPAFLFLLGVVQHSCFYWVWSSHPDIMGMWSGNPNIRCASLPDIGYDVISGVIQPSQHNR